MVFELHSNVYERNSIDTLNKSTKLYKACQIDIELHNPFPQDVVFNVQIVYEKKNPPKNTKQGSQKDKNKAIGAQGQDKNKQGAQDALKQKQQNIPEPFSCKIESQKVRKNQTINVPILFLPFELGVHKCYIIFTDEQVGELQYTIIGKAELPEVLD